MKIIQELESIEKLIRQNSSKSEYEMDKWSGSDTTYGDTEFNADAAYCGEMNAYSHSADLLGSLIAKINRAQPPL